jgi:hypothetical protein
VSSLLSKAISQHARHGEPRGRGSRRIRKRSYLWGAWR